MKMKSFKKLALLTLLLSAGIANAAVYHFHLSGAYNADWDLNSTVKPDDVIPEYEFEIANVAGSFPGTSDNHALLVFFSDFLGGGLRVYDDKNHALFNDSYGLQLYTGTEDNPTFKTGSFSFTNLGAGAIVATLNITAPTVATVPEPVSLALVGLGLAGLAGARRRRG